MHEHVHANGTLCVAPDKCQTGKGSVVFEHLNVRKKASGTYDLDLPDGRKLNASFVVMRRKQAEPFLCE